MKDTKLQEITKSGGRPTSSSSNNEDLNKDNMLLNSVLILLTSIVFFGSIFLSFGLEKFWEDHKNVIPDGYDVPKLKDGLIVLIVIPLLVLIKLLFEFASKEFLYKNVLSKKYKNPEDKDQFELGLIYKEKIPTNFFKILYYTFVSIAGLILLKDVEFFPWELLGNGDFKRMFDNGDPGYIFWNMPKHFKFYYLSGLSYVIVDFIWLVFIYVRSTDFYVTLLHHSATICLIFFSYASNFTQIGCVVLFLHDLSGITVYLIKTCILTDWPKFVSMIVGMLTIFCFAFFRCIIFAKYIYLFAEGVKNWNIYNLTLWRFLFFLLFLQVYWTYELLKRVFKKQLVDIGKVKR